MGKNAFSAHEERAPSRRLLATPQAAFLRGLAVFVARPSNCGDTLRACCYQTSVETQLVAQGNDLGYGENAQDWVIRSQAPSPLHGERRRFRD